MAVERRTAFADGNSGRLMVSAIQYRRTGVAHDISLPRGGWPVCLDVERGNSAVELECQACLGDGPTVDLKESGHGDQTFRPTRRGAHDAVVCFDHEPSRSDR